eukprot:scaffold3243_cov173-Ochromonas_danica.AAC.11
MTTADTFTSYLPTLLPLLLSSLTLPDDITPALYRIDPQMLKPLEEILNSLRVLRVALRPHIHLFVPPLCKLMTELQDLGMEASLPTQTLVVQTLRYLVSRSKGAVVEQSHVILSTLVHVLCRSILKYLAANYPPTFEIYSECMNTLTILAQQCGPRILKFDSLILRSTDGRGIDTSTYREVSALIRSGLWDEMSYADLEEGSPITYRHQEESNLVGIMKSGIMIHDDLEDRMTMTYNNTNSNLYAGVPKLLLNQQQLARSWDVSQRSTANDWNEWLWRFNVDLLRESPSPTLRACAPLAQAYPPIARELFHAAFVSCWHELSESYQESLVRALQTAFRSSTIPSDILQHLLNLAEFMEHDAEALPISLSILAEHAQKGHAYAKALHYREVEYQNNPAGCFENLININKKLDQYEAASGLLKVATQIQKKYPELKEFYTVQESWLAKLGYWDEALQKYDEKLAINPRDSIAIAGKMKCLESLGRWEEAVKLCEEHLDRMRVECEASKSNTHTKAAVIGARAAWSLNEWSLMDNCVNQLPPDNVDGSFLKAVLAVHNENYEESCRLLEETRKRLDKTISSLMTESYGRAYMPLIMAQQCSELEEITEYKMFLKEANLIEDGNGSLRDAINSNSVLTSPASSSPPPVGAGSGNSPMTTFVSPDINYENQSELLDMMISAPRRNNRHETLSHHLAASDADSANSGAPTVNSTNPNIQAIQQEALRRKAMLTEKWRRRIRGCASTGRAAIPYWKHLLNGRRMVVSEKEDLDTWLDFVSLCRNGENLTLADRVLAMTKQSAFSGRYSSTSSTAAASASSFSEDEANMELRIQFAMLKQQWSIGEKQSALQGLESLVRNSRSTSSIEGDHSYLSCLLKLGEWKVAILDPGQTVDSSTRLEVLSLYSKATLVDPNSYQAWHQWGLSNYRAIEEARAFGKKSTATATGNNNNNSLTDGNSGNKSPKIPIFAKDQINMLAANAVKGFMRALMLGTRRFSSSVTQDMLCILSLWFTCGKHSEVNAALQNGLQSVPLDNWLGVLPQLIARIDHPDQDTRMLLHNLLIRIGVKHAQALVYPLSVALKSPLGDRKEAAESLMNSLRQHSNKLIDQALMVSQELVRIAILWEEKWHWALEEASRQYFGEGPTTIREAAFVEGYRHEIFQAWENLKAYQKAMTEKGLPIPTQKTGQNQPETMMIAQAWDYYYTMFKRINTQLPHFNAFDLQSSSPALFSATDLDLGVPVIRSKQRPRRLRVIGEEGQEFAFLLKGHEDLRQDERAMQLFGLVNALLYHDRRTGVNGDDLQIQRFAVIPVSPAVGLIGWVPNCDTLHDLIRNYRESRKIMLDVEHRLILQVAPGKLYDSLPALHKLEVFEHAMNYTAGEDLAKILWLKSDNSEQWLQRRTTYTRSLAVMSMVGYILGLGDRHPSNLMLDRKTGKILHIDFGDCFEVANYRDKYPERVPFRLTRMLVNAMEVARIEGNFRSTCEKVMTVLRENRDSLVATLEAFVHDPLISWRLMNVNPKTKEKAAIAVTSNAAAAAVAAVVVPAAPATSTSVTGAIIADKNSSGPGATKVVVPATAPSADSNGAKTRNYRAKSLTTSKFLYKPSSLEPIQELPATNTAEGGDEEEEEEERETSPITTKPSEQMQTSKVVVDSESQEKTATDDVTRATTATHAASIDEQVDGAQETKEKEAIHFVVSSPSKEVNTHASSLSSQMAAMDVSSTAGSATTMRAQHTVAPTGSSTSTTTATTTATTTSPSGGLALHGMGFADHSAANDVISVSLYRNQLKSQQQHQQAIPPYIAANLQSHHSNVSCNMDGMTGGGAVGGSGGNTLITGAETSGKSAKTVSFSHTNQTIDADNTIRASSVSLAIHPSVLVGREGVDAEDQDFVEGSAMIMTSARPTVSAKIPLDSVSSGSGTSGSGAVGSGVGEGQSMGHARPGLNANLHVEMNHLAQSASLVNSNRIMSMSGRQSYLHPATLTSEQDYLKADDQQQELTEKAVVVIRRVRDKLTGLDFPETTSSTLPPLPLGGVSNGSTTTTTSHGSGVQALAVPEQVERLIREATSNENLSQSFFGWCPYW